MQLKKQHNIGKMKKAINGLMHNCHVINFLKG